MYMFKTPGKSVTNPFWTLISMTVFPLKYISRWWLRILWNNFPTTQVAKGDWLKIRWITGVSSFIDKFDSGTPQCGGAVPFSRILLKVW